MADDLRARVAEALAREDVNWGYDAGFSADPADDRTAAYVAAVLAVVQPELDRLRAACRSAAVLLRATADHRPDPTALRAAARDLDEVAGPEPTQSTTEE